MEALLQWCGFFYLGMASIVRSISSIRPRAAGAAPAAMRLEPLELRVLLDATLVDQIADVAVDQNAPPTVIDLNDHFDDPEIESTVVEFDSVLGSYFVELFDAIVPQTVANFLNYVNDGDYVNSIIHRLSRDFVIQGGAIKYDPVNGYGTVPLDAPVVNEFTNWAIVAGANAQVTLGSDTVQLPAGTDLSNVEAGDRIRLVGRTDGIVNSGIATDFFNVVSVKDKADTVKIDPVPTAASEANIDWFIFPDVNVRGTLAPPKAGGQPDSAAAGFFVSLVNNATNLDVQNEGFAAFGQIIFDGMAIVDAIAALAFGNFADIFLNGGVSAAITGSMSQLPVRNYTQQDFDDSLLPDENHLVLYNDVKVVQELSYQVVANTNPGLVAAAVDGQGMLTLNYTPNQEGVAEITVRGTDLLGNSVDNTFAVAAIDPDPVEPDDTPATANKIGIDGAPQTHSLHRSNDLDWVFFAIDTLSDVVIETDGDAGQTVITLFSVDDVTGDLTQIDRLGDGAASFTTLLRLNNEALGPGIYVACVEEDGMDGFVEQYTLSVTATVITAFVIDNEAVTEIAYFEIDGTEVKIALKTGSATLTFEGDQLDQQVTKKGFIITGQNLRLVSIDTADTTDKSKLQITGKGGDKMVELDGVVINIDNAIKSIVAKVVNFIDAVLNIEGLIGKFQANNLTDTELNIDNAAADAKATKIQFKAAEDFTIDADGPLDIKGDSFVNNNPNVDGVTTTYVKAIKIKNEAAFALNATGADAKKGVSVGNVKVGDFDGGTWTGPGDAGKFDANGIDDWTADFDGFFNSVKSKTSISDSDMQFGSAKNIEAKTNITDTDVTFTDEFDPLDAKQRAFKKFKAGKLVEDVHLVGHASFGKIEVGKAVNFNARSGVSDAVAMDALAAAAADDFDNPTIIDSVKFKGIKGDLIAMDNVFISAATISKIAAVFAAGGAGDAFGFAAVSLTKGFGYKDDDGSVKLKQADLLAGANPINAANTRLTVNRVV